MKVIKHIKIKYFILCLLAVTLWSCGHQQEVGEEEGYYTCSMHPQIREDQPGECPVCGMDLIKVSAQERNEQSLHLSEAQLKLANVKVDTVEIRAIGSGITVTGLVTANAQQVQTISSWVRGRVDRLYFKNTGDRIKAGQVLYDLYSEELLAAQREYLLTLEKQKLFPGEQIDYGSLLEALENKLLLWGLTRAQVTRLKTKQDIQTTVPIRSKISGVIMEVNIREGDYVDEGSNIYRLADLSSLWVEAELYANEAKGFQEGMKVEVRLAAFPNQVINGKAVFSIPEFTKGAKVNILRVAIPNKDFTFAPGMQAYVTLQSDQKKALAIPLDAVIRTPDMDKVWVQNQEGGFEARMVTLGIQNNRYVEVKSGLQEGDKVVVSGAYLLNSEYIFRNGTAPMAGMEI